MPGLSRRALSLLLVLHAPCDSPCARPTEPLLPPEFPDFRTAAVDSIAARSGTLSQVYQANRDLCACCALAAATVSPMSLLLLPHALACVNRAAMTCTADRVLRIHPVRVASCHALIMHRAVCTVRDEVACCWPAVCISAASAQCPCWCPPAARRDMTDLLLRCYCFPALSPVPRCTVCSHHSRVTLAARVPSPTRPG